VALKTIGLDEIDNFKIDTETYKLFWLDKEIVTTMSIPRWAQFWGIAAAISTVVLAVHTAVPDLISLYRYFTQ
jgi:hypothetical protein